MRRSQLVEKCDTEEDEALDSWGDDSASEDELEKTEKIEKKSPEAKKSENPEEVKRAENPEKEKEINSKSEVKEVEKKIDEIAEPELKKVVLSEEEKTEKSAEIVPRESDRQTPQSQESKESEWTAVDKSESDDWEQEFDIEMTEEEIKKALESVVSF